MSFEVELRRSLVATWRTTNRVTVFLLENLPDEIWREKRPASQGRTIAEIAAHLNNCRLMWGKMLGKKAGIPLPKRADRRTVTRSQAIEHLERSSEVIVRLVEFSVQRGGKIPGFPLDLCHFLGYFVAHEAHHRGQICILARQLGHRLPKDVSYGLWHWSKRAKEVREASTSGRVGSRSFAG